MPRPLRAAPTCSFSASHADAAAFEPPADAVVVDLSGAHRLQDAALAQSWYGAAPGAWSYGLPELFPPQGRLIANPGCYATAALLALGAARRRSTGAVIDAKSGVSGAGRSLKASSHAGVVLENFSPYAVGAHRHAPEIAQQLGFAVCFVPHLLPVRRGLLATCYVQTDADVRELLEAAYADAPVVRVLAEGVAPELSRVQGTDAAELGVFTDGATGTAIVICALDNLGKGAAGQAVQNANLALGLEPDRRPAAARGCSYERDRCRRLRRLGRARGDPARAEARPRRRALDDTRRPARRCGRRTACWRRR